MCRKVHAGLLILFPLTSTDLVKAAIGHNIHPKLNKAGSSGSYFARSPISKTLGIFKPKGERTISTCEKIQLTSLCIDEEPYGSLNPKWTKWFHRNFLSIFFGFGRACLLPNFSYLSEAGASLLSDRLALYIVPPTALVSLASPAFYYDYIDRRAYQKKKKPLPEKIGSFQLFLSGYKDASEFLKEHPWPGRPSRDTLGLEGTPGRRRKRRNWTRQCRVLCGRAGVDDDDDSDAEESENGYYSRNQPSPRAHPSPRDELQNFVWSKELMADFRLELVGHSMPASGTLAP